MPSPTPKIIHLETTTRCNMRCHMCVKHAPDSRIDEEDLAFGLLENITSCLPGAKALILNGIGEPLLHPNLVDMVDFARQRMPGDAWIGFQSNGLLLTESLTEKLVAAGLGKLCLSVDSLDPVQEGELHGGARVETLEKSMRILGQAKTRSPGRPLEVGVECVLMRENFRQLPKVARWAADHGASFLLVSHLIPYGRESAAQSLFNTNTEEAFRIFSAWKKKGLRQGIDIQGYFDAAWKYGKTEAQSRVVAFVGEMIEDARGQGVWLHLRSLMDGCHEDVTEIEDILAATREACSQAGIEALLPPLFAKDRRRCDFVEEGAVFIAADGGVSPCHFLWHDYACIMDGERKRMNKKMFGSLCEESLEAVWNKPEYSAFREEVLRYEYPFCNNCSFVPCDDITGEAYPFEMDCLGNAAPCGHCLWCMGGLRCLS